jgi:hypothetical protein
MRCPSPEPFPLTTKGPQQGSPPPGSLHRAPMERDTPPLEPLTTTSQSPRQRSTLQIAHPNQMSPHRRDDHLQSLLYQPLRVPSKGAPLSKSPVYEPSSRFPRRSPYYGDAHLQSLSYLSLRVPGNGAPSKFPTQSSHRERHSTPKAPCSHISKSPTDEPAPGCPGEVHT